MGGTRLWSWGPAEFECWMGGTPAVLDGWHAAQELGARGVWMGGTRLWSSDCFCFGCDVRLSCVPQRTTMLSHMSLFLAVVLRCLGLSDCGFSIETAYDMVVVYIYICL